MKGHRAQLLVAVVLLAVAVFFGVRGVRKVRHVRTVDAVCTAAVRGDWPAALEKPLDVSQPTPQILRAAECRCLALMESERRPECVELMEDLVTRAPGAWLPLPDLTSVLVVDRRDRGEVPQAADLAHRGALQYPEEMLLLRLEMDLRGRIEDEVAVLKEMVHRLPLAGATAPSLGLEIAARFMAREEWDEAEALLGSEPPEQEDLLDLWGDLRAQVMAGLGRMDEIIATFERWGAAGGDPVELRARYAILLSVFSLSDPQRSQLELLHQAIQEADALPSLDAKRALYYRYIGELAVGGHYDEALAAFDIAKASLGDLLGMTRQDILRGRSHKEFGEEGLRRTRGKLVFSMPGVRPGDVLRISPPPGVPVDTPFETLTFPANGVLAVERAVGVAPQRWVVRQASRGTVASGTVWPVPEAEVEIRIERRPVSETSQESLDPGPAAGRRRVFVVILDCGDWRLVQYLRARGDLPVLDDLVSRGMRGVLFSDPPLTAVAVSSIARPARRGVSSFLGMLYQLGTEVETMNFVGKNPFAALRWVVPAYESLFATLGAADITTVNMLRSYGPLQVGRQAQAIGPFGRVRQITGYPGSRPLSDQERQLHPTLDRASRKERELFEEAAADFDSAVALAEEGETDLLILRVDSLDLFSHAHFAEVATSGQDDGDRELFWFYRYLDLRMGDLYRALDGNDLLIVLSDHGIRTALEHDTRALFIAAGSGVDSGRLTGSPEIRGVGRMLAELFGVATNWPETELSAWARALGPGVAN